MTEEAPPLESWRRVWRDGLAPLLTLEQLRTLEFGLRTDDEHLIQGATTEPPPLQCVQDWPVEKACLTGYPFAVALGGFAMDYTSGKANKDAAKVGEVEKCFARACFEMDQRLGEPLGCRWLINWFDETPRKEMLGSLLPEIQAEIARREPPGVH